MTSNDKPKRKGAWAELAIFEDPESGLAAIISERIRGAPAYSFQVVAIDRHGPNKFIQLPCKGTVDIEHVLYSLAKRAREFIAEKLAESRQPKKPKKPGRGREKPREKKPRGGLSTLAREAAQVAGHSYVGPTQRRRDKKRRKASA